MTTNFQKIFDSLTPSQPLTFNSKLMLIDGMNMFLRNFVVNTSTNEDGIPMGGTIGFLRTLTKMIKMFTPTRVLIVFDGVGGSIRRRKLYSDYKSGRHGINIKNRMYGDEFNNENLIKLQITKLIELLKYLPVSIVMIDNIEADDVIAYISNHLPNECQKAYIVSADKDFFQLINDRVIVYSPIKDIIYTKDKFIQEFNLLPENFNIVKCILGDKSDNITGVNGIGDKKIHSNLQFLSETEYDLSSFIGQITELKENNKVCNVLYENLDTLKLNYKLMNLRDNDISLSLIDRINKYIDERPESLRIKDFSRQVVLDRMVQLFDQNVYAWCSTNFMSLNNFIKK